MADNMMRGRGGVACDDRCGCPSPCQGGTSCRCIVEDAARMEHKQCSCGHHCGCNPCSCTETEMRGTGTGKAFCKCGAGCTCPTCTAP